MNSRENRRRAGLLLLMIGAIVFLSNVVLVTAEARYLDVVAGAAGGARPNALALPGRPDPIKKSSRPSGDLLLGRR